MKRWIQNLFLDAKKRIAVTVLLGAALTALAFLFVGNELIQNRAYVLRRYQAQQQELTDSIAERAQQLLTSVDGQDTLVEELQTSSLNGSYRWCFLVRGKKLVQAKDANFLDGLEQQGILTYEELKKSCEENQQILTKCSVYDRYNRKYIVGIVTDEEYVLLEYKVTKHTTYVLMALACVCMLFFSGLTGLVLLLAKRETQLDRMRQQLTSRQQSLEKMSQEMGRADQRLAQQMQGMAREYDDALLRSLLQKSDVPELFPMGILYFRCQMGSRYVQKAQFEEWMSSMRRCLTKSQLLLEYAKGEFVVLVYRTSEAQLSQLQGALLEAVRPAMQQLRITIRVEAAILQKDGRQTPTQAFARLYQRQHPGKGEQHESVDKSLD